jgi:chromosome partitioning protein
VLALPYVGQHNDHQDALGAGLGVNVCTRGKKWRWVLKKLVEGSLDHEPHAKKAAC